MNKVCLMGRLTKDPIVRYTTGDNAMAIANFTLAVPDTKEKVNYITCKGFGKQGEFAEKYLKKGDLVGIEGRIITGSYEKDGKRVYTTDVAVDNYTLTPKFSNQEVKEDAPAEPPTGFAKIDDDDIPF